MKFGMIYVEGYESNALNLILLLSGLTGVWLSTHSILGLIFAFMASIHVRVRIKR